ncbi:hypothetical protein [Marinobacter nauticus]|uniref:Uncharacterized protein n=1 Tax=Marinobacter nauticus (strain ATCC 700491 / DSM 11845 / VT8) TaxID=351348 RepID=A1U3Z7_MARN8|nr:hypothetical protein [Marinobacter nauticus]ABM19716.1 hypothetical protein Maqu_2641 [Marinobacter nauticus VT8]
MNERLRQELIQQWQDSQLLRLGAWAIALILLVYLLLWQDDQLALKQLEWRRAQANVAEWQALAQQDYWPNLVSALENEREQALTVAWAYRTTGLAKAAVREFVNATVAESQPALRVRNLELAEPRPATGGVYEMRGRLTASTEESIAPWGWIAALESAQPAVYIDSLDIRVGRKSGVAVILEFRVLVAGLEQGASS